MAMLDREFIIKRLQFIPSPAEGFGTTRLNPTELLVKHPAATFFIKASGTSMIGAGIHPGDVLVVDRSIEARSGQVVVALLDGEFTVKRLQFTPQGGELHPENPEYAPLQVAPTAEFEVWGVVTYVLHQL
jgi:DNA polymerase V